MRGMELAKKPFLPPTMPSMQSPVPTQGAVRLRDVKDNLASAWETMTEVRLAFIDWKSRARGEVGFTMMEAKARSIIASIDELLSEVESPEKRR